MNKTKEEKDKMLLNLEIFIGVLSIALCLSMVFIAAFVDMELWKKVVLISVGLVTGFVGALIALKIEQIAGYYVCKKCHRKYVPSYGKILLAPHINRTRYMKCPHCEKCSWHKKVVK